MYFDILCYVCGRNIIKNRNIHFFKKNELWVCEKCVDIALRSEKYESDFRKNPEECVKNDLMLSHKLKVEKGSLMILPKINEENIGFGVPDFYLPEKDMFVEVKTDKNSGLSINQINWLLKNKKELILAIVYKNEIKYLLLKISDFQFSKM